MARALVVAALLGALVLPAVARSGDTARVQPVRLSALESAVLVRVNDLRQARGLARLTTATGLRRAAASHSQAMLAQGFFAHESSDGTTFHARVRRFYPSRNVRFWRVAENLAAMTGEISAEEAVSMWLESPPHRRILLDPAWREAGVGAFHAESTGIFPGSGDASVVTLDVGVRRS